MKKSVKLKTRDTAGAQMVISLRSPDLDLTPSTGDDRGAAYALAQVIRYVAGGVPSKAAAAVRNVRKSRSIQFTIHCTLRHIPNPPLLRVIQGS